MKRLALTLIVPILLSGARAAEPVPKKRAITLDELSEGFEVIGHLGVPLGQVASVDAVLRVGGPDISKAMQGQAFLEVVAVDGKALASPVRMSFSLNPQARGSGLDPKVEPGKPRRGTGRTFRLLVHESAGFRGIPGGLPGGVVPAGVGFGLSSNLSVWKVLSSDVCLGIDLNDRAALEKLLEGADPATLKACSAALARMAAGPSRDRAVALFAIAVAGEDPDSAKRWAESIADRRLRRSTQELIAD